ncbi:cytidine deaminase [Meredithblackwellia eburnea MCA 4105]
MVLTIEQRSTLISQALDARQGSYSPYSNFRVGACLLAEDGTFIKGANVENASYGGAICAERTAIVKAVSEGRRKFIGLAVSSDVKAPISPCGICRQVLREFCGQDMPILLVPAQYTKDKTVEVTLKEMDKVETGDKLVVTSMAEILPFSFGPEDLERPQQ